MKHPLPQTSIKANRMLGVLQHRPLLGPQTVHFDIANGCNVRCVTCWHHSPLLNIQHVPTPEWKRKQLSFQTFKEILDEVIKLQGLEHIILSGMGDPSLNDDLSEMVHYAHSHTIGVTIITNLLRVDLEKLFQDSQAIRDGLLELLVSINGVTADVWNTFHAMSSGFDQLLNQLEYLKQAGFQAKHVQVINAQNYHQLPDMIRFGKDWSAKRINFKFASLTNGTEACGLTVEQKKELLNTLIPRAKAIASFHQIDTDLDAFASQVLLEGNRTAPIAAVGCHMGTVYCRITVDLEVLYCCNTEVSIGHLSETVRFRSLWFSDEYNTWRERMKRGEYLDSCYQCGKYKQNLRWAERLNRLNPQTVSAKNDCIASNNVGQES